MDRRYVRLDPQKLDYLRLKLGWNLEELFSRPDAEACPLDKRTVKAIVNGDSAFLNSAKIVATLLGAENLVSVLHPDLLRELKPPSTWDHPSEFFTTVGEWDVLEPVEGEQRTTNGLHFDVWKLRHRHVAGRIGRGKCYDLSQLSTNDRARLRSHLTRHSQVCDKVGSHPNIARNLSATEWEHGGFWWVIDEWVDGRKLSALLAPMLLTPGGLPKIMRQIASALETMHAAGIVRRELSPRFVFIRNADEAAVLTDFELAKLLDGAPTVSPQADWPDDDYRAIETDAHETIDARADIYSWGRILVHAACGALPAKGQEAEALAKAKLPPAVRRIALSSVAMPRSDRPDSMTQVITAIKNWT
ncbi:MAG: protein kinase [Planctomycetia bacterium]|nr:protein kinase [Planctomycetia bacterium]